MSNHRFYRSPTGKKLDAQRDRMHRNRRGQEKDRFTPDEAERIILKMYADGVHGKLQSYPCHCGWIHIGHQPTPSKASRFDPVTELEMGERVEACIRLENTGSQAERIAHIVARGHAAERRSLTRPSPPTPS